MIVLINDSLDLLFKTDRFQFKIVGLKIYKSLAD